MGNRSGGNHNELALMAAISEADTPSPISALAANRPSSDWACAKSTPPKAATASMGICTRRGPK